MKATIIVQKQINQKVLYYVFSALIVALLALGAWPLLSSELRAIITLFVVNLVVGSTVIVVSYLIAQPKIPPKKTETLADSKKKVK